MFGHVARLLVSVPANPGSFTATQICHYALTQHGGVLMVNLKKDGQIKFDLTQVTLLAPLDTYQLARLECDATAQLAARN